MVFTYFAIPLCREVALADSARMHSLPLMYFIASAVLYVLYVYVFTHRALAFPFPPSFAPLLFQATAWLIGIQGVLSNWKLIPISDPTKLIKLDAVPRQSAASALIIFTVLRWPAVRRKRSSKCCRDSRKLELRN
jgi:hypothetical protein